MEDAAKDAQTQVSQALEAERKMARILVIDDDEEMRQMLVRILDGPDHELVEAPDGEIGLQLFRRAPADIIITDILMPEKDGLELIQSLKREDSSVRIIAISGGGRGGRSNYLKEAAEFGADACLAKPFGNNELRETVYSLLA